MTDRRYALSELHEIEHRAKSLGVRMPPLSKENAENAQRKRDEFAAALGLSLEELAECIAAGFVEENAEMNEHGVISYWLAITPDAPEDIRDFAPAAHTLVALLYSDPLRYPSPKQRAEQERLYSRMLREGFTSREIDRELRQLIDRQRGTL